MNVVERNKLARKIVNDLISEASSEGAKPIDSEVSNLIKVIMSTEKLGFRGIVITSIVAWKLDDKFDPFENFYDCNPRSIFENGIRLALVENQIPCGKSDPLNVAKNANQINKGWAKGKRPEVVANAVVSLLEILHDKKPNSKSYQKIVNFFFGELLKKKFIANKVTYADLDEEFSWENASSRISKFIVNVPEGGAVPQFFCGYLLHLVRQSQGGKIIISGYDSDVNSTNTTSKKPGDFWEENKSGEIVHIYEVTVKKIDENRLSDSFDSILAYDNTKKFPITFLCRIPEDVDALQLEENQLNFRGHEFHFLNIEAWFYYNFLNIPQEYKMIYMTEIEEFMKNLKRKEKTLASWMELISSLQR